MQLEKPNKFNLKSSKTKLNLTEAITLAATALVGGTTQAQETESDWEFSASSLVYSEPDRVGAVELIFAGDKDYGDSANIDFKVVLDSLTGASATGAIEQNTPQTFTRPSGRGNYQVDANTVPLDDTFKDTRVQINAAWTDAFADDMRYTVGTNLSKEYDYLSLSLNGEIARDLNQKNTTLSAGVSFGNDEYSPEGNIPIAFSSMVIDQGQFATRDDFWTAFDATRGASSESVTTSELLLGWTQVVNRRMLFQLNYGYADKSGFLTDPFKILSVVDASGVTQNLIYENRPDARTQHSLFAMTKYHFEESIFDISYRYISDDWDIQSHTIDAHWRFFAADNSFWEPHVRFYQQSAAEFYQPFISDTTTTPEFASADYRIGDMTAMTVGLKYGFTLNGGDRAEIRLEYYLQTPKEANQPQGIANLEGLDLYPEVDALILQFNYYF
jgi:hypothetical protein